MPLQLTRQQLLLRGSMRRERPARSARTALPETACVASEGKEEKRHFRQSHCHDPEMNAEAEGGRLLSQIKTDECKAWTCFSVTSSVSAAACSSLRPCDPPARTPTPRRIRLS